jgi:histone demethylase JARID1
MFTCPICDWRVKIPRDAARPRLEDLQAWQDEVLDLPFQPEEEELLNRIVGKAQAFRDFLSQYTNGNQLCRTIEEMPEMLFYLRKIEGAEVLLAYETNLFRQELHKWQPIAPEAPPIISQSGSTRKPRPTKQQKLMKELGVERPEDLPAHLRTKTYTRRKTQDSAFATSPGGTLMPKPFGESPAPGSASTPGAQGRSATPVGMPRQASTGNAPANGVYDPALTNGRPGEDFEGNYSANSPSPMFSPTQDRPEGLRDPMIGSALSRVPTTSSRNHDLSFPTFRPVGLGIDAEDDLRNGLAHAHESGEGSGPSGVSPTGEDYDMFMNMNQDGEADGEAVNDDNPAPSLEQETSHASEALEMIAGNVRGQEDDAGLEDGDNLDEFLSGGVDGERD